MIYLLDTDVLDHFFRGNANVRQRAHRAGASSLAITVVTRIEVLRARFEALLKAATATELLRAQFRLTESETLLSQWRVVTVDEAACRELERLRTAKGIRKIGRADMLIASIALAHDATLVTRNIKDFALVPGLTLENWVN